MKFQTFFAVAALCMALTDAASLSRFLRFGRRENSRAHSFQSVGIPESPMINAVEQNDIEMVQTLIESGDNINYRDSQGKTALIAAAANDDNSMIMKSLLTAGADVNAQQGNGITALMWAAAWGDVDVINMLMSVGDDSQTLDLEVKDKLGNTALHWAIMSRNEDAAITLIQSGASTLEQNESGQTPESLALEYNLDRVVNAIAQV